MKALILLDLRVFGSATARTESFAPAQAELLASAGAVSLVPARTVSLVPARALPSRDTPFDLRPPLTARHSGAVLWLRVGLPQLSSDDGFATEKLRLVSIFKEKSHFRGVIFNLEQLAPKSRFKYA